MDILRKILSQEKTDTGIHVGEAYILWTQLQAWYDVLEVTEICINYARDTDLKLLLDQGISKLINKNIHVLENSLKHFQITFPPRPPKAFKTPSDTETLRDEFIFRLIFDISQASLLFHAKAINICINDSLRNLFMNFLTSEMHAYDNLVKYGKSKGWVHPAPVYKQ